MNDSNKELVVLLQNTPIGVLSEDKQGKHSFTYFPETDESLRLSIAMPHRVSAWTGKVVEAYIDGILPDDPNVRQRIGRQYGVNARNPFALLSAIGLECAGGVQFVPLEDVDSLHERNELVPVSEQQIGERLRTLTRDGQASWLANDEHWSLNGAQEKIALRRQNGQWYEAHGAAATTHIIKPGISSLHAQAFNEYLCMKTIANLGVPTAVSTFCMFDGIPAIVSKRWDRIITAEGGAEKVTRIHQEDFCQALGYLTAQKYQSDGGPGATEIIRFLYSERFSETDIQLFYIALVLNFLLGGTDAHAKNYAILELPGTAPTLAPLYDIASMFPYDTQRKQRKLAMSIGKEYNYERIELRHWDRLADEIHATCAADDKEFLHFALKHYAQELLTIFIATAQMELKTADTLDSTETAAEQRSQLVERIQAGVETQCGRVLHWFK